MARWDGHVKKDPAIARKEKTDNQREKRQAISAARPAKPRKAKLPSIALPIERVNVVLPVEHLIGEAVPAQQPQVKLPIQRVEPKLSTGEQGIRQSKAHRILETKADLLTCELASEISKLKFWLNGEYGFAMAEKATDVSKEAEADRQAHWHKVERKMLAQWKTEELEEMEEEYRCSLIRIPPFTELVARAGFDDALRALIQDIAKSLAKEHKQRRKTFEEHLSKAKTEMRKAPKSVPRKPSGKVRADRTDVELIDFITKRLVTHAFLFAKAGRL